eukprot:213265-Rhodomonas_salina.1
MGCAMRRDESEWLGVCGERLHLHALCSVLRWGRWQRVDAKTPVMCAYKLVTIEFPYFGLTKRVEGFLVSPAPFLDKV